MDRTDKRKAWNYGLGMIKIDGLKPSPEFLELVEKEINGEITDEDIQKWLDDKYTKLGEEENK